MGYENICYALHDDPALAAAMSRAGRERAVEEYDEQVTSQRLYDLMFNG